MSSLYYPSGTTQSYANLAAFPTQAAPGSLAIALDTGILYEHSASTGSWTVLADPSGGAGSVSGPASSTVNGVASYTDTTGTVIKDSVLSNKGILVAAGSGQDASPIVLGSLGIAFAGSAPNEVAPYTLTPLYAQGTTGWLVNPNSDSGVDYLCHYMSGRMAYHTHVDGNNNINIALVNGTIIRPDPANTAQVGTPQQPMANISATRFTFGNLQNSARKLFMYDDLQSAGANFPGPGIGFDSGTGSEWYFASIDRTLGLYRENLNFSYNNRVTTISAPDETTNDAVAAAGLIVKGANKTDGTGNGGNLALGYGTSVGGARGNVYLAAEAGAPSGTPAAISGYVAMQFDSTNNKLYAYLGGGWKSVTLT